MERNKRNDIILKAVIGASFLSYLEGDDFVEEHHRSHVEVENEVLGT